MADCPHGSDEADCSCADLDMHSCIIMGLSICILPEWTMNDSINIPICQNEINQDGVNRLVTWQSLGKY